MNNPLILSETELILNNDGSIYHLGLKPEHISENVIVVGDPNRVKQISKYFDSISYKIEKREFVTHVGFLNKKQITVISSGIGVDNVELLMTELDFLVNFDLKTRKEKETKKQLSIIRIGTSGAIQEEIKIDTFALSNYAIGLDNLMDFYELNQSRSNLKIIDEFKSKIPFQTNPYLVQSSNQLFEKFGKEIMQVNTLTCPGFYAPQGRKTRAIKQNNLIGTFKEFDFEGFKLHNLEMETAGYYAFGQMFNHQVVSLNAILANRISNEFSQNPDLQVDKLIRLTLDLIWS